MLLTFAVNGQGYFLNGYLKDSVTHYAIAGGILTNTNSVKTVVTDQNGFFRLEVSPNNLITAKATAYTQNIINYSVLFDDTIIIYLSPAGILLPTVSVASRYTKYQLDSMSRRKEFESNRGGRLSTVSPSQGFGIAINLDRIFKKKYKFQRKNEKRFDSMEKGAYVAYRYPAQFVAHYTGLKGQELQNFINRHAPSYEWLRKHRTDEEVIYFINDQLKLFKAGYK